MDAAAIAEAAERLAGAKHIVAVTGAGISVESGIPDFRSPGGLWTKYPPGEYATIEAYLENPDKVWKLWHELGRDLAFAQPNPGHIALANLEAAGRLGAVITQNIDNLHQAAGSRKVIEYHGNARHLVCLSCGREEPLETGLPVECAPRCSCSPGALMKPAIVFFGEMIPSQAAMDAENWAQVCDAMIIVGTSATVYPCAGLPMTAKAHGAVIVECNVGPTEYTSRITDVFVQGKAGETLPALAAALGAR
ncbi:MAG: NAD-dependent protein deacylase [Candidatus Hydrogenedens sp.]|nr:NAD-dependent protein deacylase [Candidatus Hydrogenedens sp.]